MMTIKFKAIRTYLKSFCHWSLSTSLCQPKYSAFWTEVCQNFDFTRYIKQPSISTSFLSGGRGFRSDSDFPPIVACFHRLPGKHWDYCRGLPSCFWSIHVLSNSRFLQPNSRVLNYEIPWFQLRFISSLGFNIINLLSLNLSAGLMTGSYARGCNWLQDSMLFINLNINLWQRYESRRRQNASQAQ